MPSKGCIYIWTPVNWCLPADYLPLLNLGLVAQRLAAFTAQVDGLKIVVDHYVMSISCSETFTNMWNIVGGCQSIDCHLVCAIILRLRASDITHPITQKWQRITGYYNQASIIAAGYSDAILWVLWLWHFFSWGRGMLWTTKWHIYYDQLMTNPTSTEQIKYTVGLIYKTIVKYLILWICDHNKAKTLLSNYLVFTIVTKAYNAYK